MTKSTAEGDQMPSLAESTVTTLLEAQRAEATLRRESLGPIVEAIGVLRACSETIRLLLDEIDSSVGVHPELLDAVFVSRHGSRWWEQLDLDRGDDQ
jgi:hypothetical protein